MKEENRVSAALADCAKEGLQSIGGKSDKKVEIVGRGGAADNVGELVLFLGWTAEVPGGWEGRRERRGVWASFADPKSTPIKKPRWCNVKHTR